MGPSVGTTSRLTRSETCTSARRARSSPRPANWSMTGKHFFIWQARATVVPACSRRNAVQRHLSAGSRVAFTRRLVTLPGRWPRPRRSSDRVNATRDPAERCLWTALRLEQAGTTVARACQIKKCFPVIDQFAGRGEDLARRADVHVSLLVKREVVPTEGPIVALRLVDHRDVRRNLLVFDEPV